MYTDNECTAHNLTFIQCCVSIRKPFEVFLELKNVSHLLAVRQLPTGFPASTVIVGMGLALLTTYRRDVSDWTTRTCDQPCCCII